MNTLPTLLALPLCLASAAITPALAAADLTIDDFTSGFYRSPPVKAGTQSAEQTGSMLGNFRDTTLFMCDPAVPGDCAGRNPYSLSASYAIAPSKDKAHPASAFVQSAGFETPPRVEISYGYGPGGMVKDLSGGPGRRLRFSFLGLSQPLNFNVLMYTGSGRGQDGCNVLEINHPFALEIPLSEFTMANGGFSASAIDHIALIFQSGSTIGSVEFGLEKIEVSDTPQAGAIHCGPIGS